MSKANHETHFKITDFNSGKLVWSNSYWYSGLEIQRTIELCVKNSVIQIDKIQQTEKIKKLQEI